MGDIQQIDLIQKLAPRMSGPILEIGSKRYGGPPISYNYRTLFPAATSYVGVDAEAGEGVDVVVDMTTDIEALRKQVGAAPFRSVICLSVLEHVRDIFRFARNVEALVAEGGMVILSVPFAWEIHAYPGDYWRFTPEAIRYLFPAFDFDLHLSQVHTDWGRTMSLDAVGSDPNRWTMYFSAEERNDRTARGRLKRVGFSLLRRAVGLKKNMLYSTMFDMVGIKR